MKNHNYFELIAFYHQSIFDLIRGGYNIEIANARSFEDFWCHSKNPDVLNNLVVIIESINVEFSLTKKYRKKAIELYKEYCLKVEELELHLYFTEYENEVFKESVEVLNAELANSLLY